LAIFLVVSGCANVNVENLVDNRDKSIAPSDRFPGFGAGDRDARHYASRGGFGTVSNSPGKGAQVFPGAVSDASATDEGAARSDVVGSTQPASPRGSSDRAPGAGATPSSDGRSYQLNFDGAEVAAVSKAILGDILGVNYLLDPRVTGQINLTSSQPVPRASLIPLLETSLLSVNAGLTKDGAVYRISPVAEPRGAGHVDFQSIGDGYGTTVIGARYVAAATLAKVLDGLGGRTGTVKVEPTANLVMIQGTAAERRAIANAADMVDVDWMRSKSVALLPVRNAAPETVITELNRILGTGEGGLSQSMVQLQPVSRLNAVLAVSQRRDAIDHVTRWVQRLDKADYAASGVKVYRLKYAQAKSVAAMLNRMFGARQGSASGQSDNDQLEPGQDGTESSTAATEKPAMGSTQQAQSQPGSSGTSGASNASNANSPSPIKTAFSDPSAQKSFSADDAAGQSGPRQGGKVRVTPDISNNTLFIETGPQIYPMVEQAIREMDRFPTQVSIEVTIAEVTLTNELRYGVQFFLQKGKFSAGLGGLAGIPLQTTYPGLNLAMGALSNPQVVLDALSSMTSVKVLSSPSLVVVDRQPAVLQVGDQVPILTRQLTSAEGTSTANSVDLKDTGIILNVLPRVNANGIVNLSVEQQISNVVNTADSNAKPGGDTPTLTPTISQRRVRSTISVPSGQMVLLAGLIREEDNFNRNGIPIITEIKALNDLLTSHDRKGTRTELIIFIRPKIIASSDDAQRVSEEFLDRLRSIERVAPPVTRAQAGRPPIIRK